MSEYTIITTAPATSIRDTTIPTTQPREPALRASGQLLDFLG